MTDARTLYHQREPEYGSGWRRYTITHELIEGFMIIFACDCFCGETGIALGDDGGECEACGRHYDRDGYNVELMAECRAEAERAAA